MLLALLTDIHEDIERLRAALRRFSDERVDQVVVIGDIFETGERIEETCRLLTEARAIGVWGNHDYGLCFEVDDFTRGAYPPTVIDYMTSLRPRLEIAGCLFTHVEPWLNAERVEDLWYFDGPPDEPWKLDRIFAATPHRILFAGHYHRWLAAGPSGVKTWDGTRELDLYENRWFIVVGALCQGRCAIFDTEACKLMPINSL